MNIKASELKISHEGKQCEMRVFESPNLNIADHSVIAMKREDISILLKKRHKQNPANTSYLFMDNLCLFVVELPVLNI